MRLREVRELALACACHLAIIVALRMVQFPTLLRYSRRRLPAARKPLSFSRLQHIAGRSRRLCRGTCLSESVVLRLLATRHGFPDLPLGIGISRSGGTLRAHAWAGAASEAAEYTPILLDGGRAPVMSARASREHLAAPVLDPRGGE